MSNTNKFEIFGIAYLTYQRRNQPRNSAMSNTSLETVHDVYAAAIQRNKDAPQLTPDEQAAQQQAESDRAAFLKQRAATEKRIADMLDDVDGPLVPLVKGGQGREDRELYTDGSIGLWALIAVSCVALVGLVGWIVTHVR